MKVSTAKEKLIEGISGDVKSKPWNYHVSVERAFAAIDLAQVDTLVEVREIVEKTRTVQEDDVDFGWNGAVDLILAKLKELEK